MDKKPLIVVSLYSMALLTIVSVTSMGAYAVDAQLFSSINERSSLSDSSRGETELKYYTEENLDQVIGFAGGPIIWKTAIRLTQDEMAFYSDWTITKVNVAFSAESALSEINVRIYVYEAGSTSTRPGPIIVNDTTDHLNTTGVTTIPLVTPVRLSGHQQLWVAVEWYQTQDGPGIYYAWIDTLSGPHVENKSDFIYLGANWYQLHDQLPGCDGRWGIGAIIEGLDTTELSIGNIKGPVGITADVSNIGGLEVAQNVSWSIAVSGGLLHRVAVLKNGTVLLLAVNSSVGIDSDTFFGFGKINIMITAKAENAPEVFATKTAFLFGPYVIRIR